MASVPKARRMLQNLAIQWDETASVRDRLRENLDPMSEVSEKQVDIKIGKFKDLLLPILRRMSTSNGCKLPAVEELRSELAALMEFSKRAVVDADIQKWAWMIRKNLGFIKLKCRRNEVSCVSCLV